MTVHGTCNSYNMGCRCADCLGAKRDYRRTHRNSLYNRIPPGMSRRHCQICGEALNVHPLRACWREVR